MRSAAACSGSGHAPRTRELSQTYGYDTKYAMHALRIAHQGYEPLTEGHITLPVPEPHRSPLMRVRAGAVSLEDVLTELHDRTARLEQVILRSDLPDEVDRVTIDRFLVDAYQQVWAASSFALDPRIAGQVHTVDPAELEPACARHYLMNFRFAFTTSNAGRGVPSGRTRPASKRSPTKFVDHW